MISQAEWDQFANDLKAFNDEVANQEVTWKVPIIKLPRFNEDPTPTYESRSLRCLVSYNAFRVWPMDRETEPGAVDKQYLYLLLNHQYLADNGWLTANKNFDFNPNQDIFIVNGMEHTSSGDTPVSAEKSFPLYSIVVLERKTTATSSKSRP